MMIFPGNLSAFCRMFQSHVLPFFFHDSQSSFKLSSAQALVASLAPSTNSYAHLCAMLKAQTPVKLTMTEAFKERLYNKHKIAISETQVQNIHNFLETPLLSMVPFPTGLRTATTEPWQELNILRAKPASMMHADLLKRIVASEPHLDYDWDACELATMEEYDIDFSYGRIDRERVVVEALSDDYHRYREQAPPKDRKTFYDWLKMPSIKALRARLEHYCDSVNHDELQQMLVTGKELITSFDCDWVDEISDASVRQLLIKRYGSDSLVCTWQTAAIEPLDGIDFQPDHITVERSLAMAVFKQGEWIAIGRADALSMAGNDQRDFLGFKPLRFEEDLAALTLDYLEDNPFSQREVRGHKINNTITSTMILNFWVSSRPKGMLWDTRMNDRTTRPKRKSWIEEDREIEAFLVAQLTRPSTLIAYQEPPDDFHTDKDIYYQAICGCLGYVGPTTVAFIHEDWDQSGLIESIQRLTGPSIALRPIEAP